MSVLDAVADWPVAHASAAVVGRAGVLTTYGDLTHPFRLASLTKPLTALAALVAVEEEALSLDAALPALAGVPAELAAELPTATLRHLLSHSSGIAADRRQRMADPGTRRIYSNAGMEVVGDCVAAATEIPFAQYLAEAVFAPLGLTSTTLDGSPAHAGVSTVGDYSLLVAELLAPAGRLLHPSTLAAAATVQFPGLRGVLPGYGGQEHNDWGLGFEIRADKQPHWTSPRNSPATYGHFGQSGTMFWIDPVAGLGLVALADSPFGPWAVEAWPALSSAVLAAY